MLTRHKNKRRHHLFTYYHPQRREGNIFQEEEKLLRLAGPGQVSTEQPSATKVKTFPNQYNLPNAQTSCAKYFPGLFQSISISPWIFLFHIFITGLYLACLTCWNKTFNHTMTCSGKVNHQYNPCKTMCCTL